MERFVLKNLADWKNSTDRKPLILNGARQVGKTWVLREFARREYRKEAYVVCRKNGALAQVFSGDFDTARILRSLRALTGVDITPGDTLIILDEVQEVPEAIESLKYFCESAPDYHIAVAGSLLGLAMHSGVSFPVGKVNTLDVHPLNFEEFLLAVGEMEKLEALRSKDFIVTNILHDKYVELLRQYYFVGGMPEAVREYAETGGLKSVRRIQNEILRGYEFDFSKHSTPESAEKIRMVWRSIPSQLFKENKKFIYGALRTGARAKEYEYAIQWLVDSGVATKVPLCTKVSAPLAIYEDISAFKLYLLDIGLLGAMVSTDPKDVLIGDNIFTEYKGGMTENYVLQQMVSRGITPIYYHKSDSSRLEIDFIIQRDGRPLPIEVKAETNVRANSLSALLAATPDLKAIRYSMLPYREQGQMTCVPLYAV